MSDGKCQQRSNLQKWIAVVNTPRTDTHRIYAMHTLIMTFTFADLTAVDICHPTIDLLHLLELHAFTWIQTRNVSLRMVTAKIVEMVLVGSSLNVFVTVKIDVEIVSD